MFISEQDQSYKRGLVLGLTMAEIIILVLFCLLLALSAIFAKQRDSIDKQQQEIAVLSEELDELRNLVNPEQRRILATLIEYWQQYAPQDYSLRQYFNELVLQVQQLEQLRRELETLVERNRELSEQLATVESEAERLKETEKRYQELVDKYQGLLDKNASFEEIADSLSAMGIDLSSEQGTERLREALDLAESIQSDDRSIERINDAMEALEFLESLGSGSESISDIKENLAELKRENIGLKQLVDYYMRRFGYPPCWSDANGNIDYTFNVKLTSNGYVLVRLDYPRHNDHPMLPTIKTVTTDREISPGQFEAETLPIFEWSVKNDCRFFVRVYDETGEQEKRIFQERMRVLEGHFYKREHLNEQAPF